MHLNGGIPVKASTNGRCKNFATRIAQVKGRSPSGDRMIRPLSEVSGLQTVLLSANNHQEHLLPSKLYKY